MRLPKDHKIFSKSRGLQPYSDGQQDYSNLIHTACVLKNRSDTTAFCLSDIQEQFSFFTHASIVLIKRGLSDSESNSNIGTVHAAPTCHLQSSCLSVCLFLRLETCWCAQVLTHRTLWPADLASTSRLSEDSIGIYNACPAGCTYLCTEPWLCVTALFLSCRPSLALV